MNDDSEKLISCRRCTRLPNFSHSNCITMTGPPPPPSLTKPEPPAAAAAGGGGAPVGEAQQAFLHLVSRKPPARIEGLLQLARDTQLGRYSAEEMERMTSQENSDAGRRLSTALARCEGMKQKMQREQRLLKAAMEQASNPQQPQQQQHQQQARKAQIVKMKDATIQYVDCLSYMSCPERWKQYTQCWTDLSSLPLPQLREISNSVRQQGVGFEIFCHKERHALERCVGNLVSEAVRSADTPADSCAAASSLEDCGLVLNDAMSEELRLFYEDHER